jgi:NADH-quinone oxidoreductase subunit G
MSGINFTINGKAVAASRGETILDVARREGIDIPTMCYLTKVTPIASCRMCVVEADNTEGFILSCQTPPVEGVAITTESESLKKHRQNIMRMYAVNHPLECGVCDKSGECDLQNKTLEYQIGDQAFSAKDQKRPIEDWGLIQYDPSLCILCEKCVSTCNEAIGDDAIEVKFGGYGSQIQVKNSDRLDCTYCGECIAVCPVGALISKDFKYRANAWESERIPASCAHCSGGCALYYDVRNGEKITRVTNDFEYMSLCGAGRFGFDFENRVYNDVSALDQAVEAVQKAQTIRFNSYITNEEALILQRLKEHNGIKLINNEALAYQKFLQAYGSVVGKDHYSASAADIRAADLALVFGSAVTTDAPMVRYLLNESSKRNRAKVVYMHPIEDETIRNIVTTHVKYEVGSEEGVIALTVKRLLRDAKLPDGVRTYLNELDEGYLSAESNVGEEEIEKIAEALERASNRLIVLGSDLYAHRRAENIARLAALLEQYLDFKVMIIPTATNTLGVAKICDLDEHADGFTVGYNASGDYVISSDGSGNFHVPALNQQEGTFTNYEGIVTPTNVALAYDGASLNDIADRCGVYKKHTIDYTCELPKERGYQERSFDALSNDFGSSLDDGRGYRITTNAIESGFELESVADLESYDGMIAYRANPYLQFSYLTNRASQIAGDLQLIGSGQFALAAKIENGMKIKVLRGDESVECQFALDENLKGTIALLGDYDQNPGGTSRYRYDKIKIEQVGQ